ncbi:MAG: OB-fold domain-containing protein [Chloroflexi bacterium]|nr:OB-fold domain-containing protein [Chloroflexota bacterium]
MQTPVVEGLFEMSGGDGLPHLLISRCGQCGAVAFPARKRCAACCGTSLVVEEAPGEGTVYSWTVIRELGGHRAEFEPYVVAQVDLSAGLRVQGLVDAAPETVAIGQRVRTGLTAVPNAGMDPGVVTYCFVPAGEGTR